VRLKQIFAVMNSTKTTSACCSAVLRERVDVVLFMVQL